MKIALFTDTYLPHINGVATHVKTLKEGLEKIGHEVLVVTADTSASEYYVKDGILHCPAKEIRRFYGNGAANPVGTKFWLIRHHCRFDIIHIHTEFSMGITGLLMAREQKIPVIFTMHTMWDQYMHYIASPGLIPAARKAGHAYLRRFLKNVDRIIGPSPRVKGYLKVCGVKKRVNVVPNAVEMDVFSGDQVDKERLKSVKKRLGISDDDFVICFCGRLGSEKSVDTLIDYFSGLYGAETKIKLLIAGEGPARHDLVRQAKRLGIKDCVIFTGSVPHERMREIYACGDLYATASRSEVNSISMLEAMAMGLPVIHIVDDENPGQVIEGVNGYTYRTKEEFQQVVNRLFSDPDELNKMQISTADSVHHARQEELAGRVERVYRKVLAHRRSGVR